MFHKGLKKSVCFHNINFNMITLFSATVTGLKLCPPSGCSEGRKRRADDDKAVFADVSVSSECDPDEEDECSFVFTWDRTEACLDKIETSCGLIPTGYDLSR